MRVLKSLLRIVLVFGVLLLLGWLYFAQPTWRKNTHSEQKIALDDLKRHVDMLSVEFHPRDYKNPANLNRAADYIRQEFEKAGAETEFQEFEVYRETYKNVIGRFPGTGERKIILGAHYDSCGDTPGADDNASGVAGLIEIAKLLTQTELKHTIELVAYTLEEPPFFRTTQMGSFFHAESLDDERDQLDAVIVLEMIGYFSEERGSQSYPAGLLHAWYPSKGNFIAVVGGLHSRKMVKAVKIGMSGTSSLDVRSISAPRSLPGIDFSDHQSYWAQEIDAVMVTDTAFYRNHAYHKLNDVASRLNYERMAQVAVGVFEAVRKMDSGH